MTILSVVQSAALVVGIERPDMVFASTDRTAQEVQEAINASLYQILDDYDWQALIKPATVTGDGTATSFPLPDDYYRMTRLAELYNSSGLAWRVTPVSPEAFLMRSTMALNGYDAHWSIFGNAINIGPARPTGEAIKFLYVSKNAVRDQASAPKDAFTADTDTFVLPERLLRLCFIANWKRNKGVDYASDLNEYEIALSYATAADKGTQISRSGTPNSFRGAVPAWPWNLG